MAGSIPFSYERLFASGVLVSKAGGWPHAKYDFAVAYPDPDTLPLDGLADSLRAALHRDGKDLAFYPDAAGLHSLRVLLAEKLGRDRNMVVTPEDVVLTAGSSEAIVGAKVHGSTQSVYAVPCLTAGDDLELAE